jgi:hypothetical protein
MTALKSWNSKQLAEGHCNEGIAGQPNSNGSATEAVAIKKCLRI